MNRISSLKRTSGVLWALALGLSLLIGLSLILNPPSTLAQFAAREAPEAIVSPESNTPAAPATQPASTGSARRLDVQPPDFVLAGQGPQILLTEDLPDVNIWKGNTPGDARPNGVINYGMWYANSGAIVAGDVRITDTLPLSTTYVGDNSGFAPEIGANGVITWHVGALDPGESHLFVLTLHVDGAVAEGPGMLAPNCLAIHTTTAGDPDPGNDQACSGPVNVGNADVEMGVDTFPNPGDPAPGQEMVYDIRVCNNRGAAAGPVTLIDTLPAHTSFVSWNADAPWAVGWQEVDAPTGKFVLTTAGFPGNFCDSVHLRLQVAADTPFNVRLSNYVQLAVAGDVNMDNNERLNTDANTARPRYDLNANKWFVAGVLTPGGWVRYGSNHWNGGNMSMPGMWITDTLPADTAYQLDSAQRHDGQNFPPDTATEGAIGWDLGAMPVATGFGFDFSVDIDDGIAPGTLLTNCIAISGDEADSYEQDNTSCVVMKVNAPGPNLRVTKESWWNGDGQIGYRINFWNVGDASVANVRITDTLPTGTAWDGWWNLNWDWGRLVTQSLNSDVLVWQFDALNPGDSGNIEFNANLDEPGAPLRWYTNTVEIAPLAGDMVPADNTYEDVAFSGGEVQWVDFDVYRTRVWGCAPQAPITVTTALAEMTFWDTCWNENNFPDTFDPGDVIAVTAGAGLHPVIIAIPDPFTGYINSDANTVWGQIDALDHQQINIDLWSFPPQWVETDNQGHYSATYSDIPHGAEGDVGYWADIDYARVGFHHRLTNYDLALEVNYSHEWVEGHYEGGHTVWLTVTDELGTLKATAELTTGQIPWWGGGQTGFSTSLDDPWQPQRPDLAPGDFVYGATETGYTATVKIGLITGHLDVEADRITGTVEVPWLMPGPVTVDCHPWGAPGGAPSRSATVIPNGVDTYSCAWDPNTEWDILPGQDVGVRYGEPDGGGVYAAFHAPAPHLRVEKWLDGGNPGADGNAVFYIQYRNEGDAPAGDVLITDTLQGMTYLSDTLDLGHTGSGGQVAWNLGTVEPGDWLNFYVFAQVNAAAGEQVVNAVKIATSNPYDQGEDWQKHSEWRGEVQPNDTRLTVDKGAWTGDPAAGYDVVFHINACNKGGTGSTQVTLTDTLHPSMTLKSWWSDTSGWVEVSRSTQELVVSRPAINGWRCEGVYVRATVDAAASPGQELWNHAVIVATNDLNPADNEAWWGGRVNQPHHNLNINASWAYGQLVPGGDLHYNVNIHNNGNIPVGSFRITETLPVSTTFVAAWLYGNVPFVPVMTGADYVVWEYPGLDNGYRLDFEIVLKALPNAAPGTVLVNTVEITRLPGEDDWKDNQASWTETLFDHGPNLRVRKDAQWDNWGENTRRASYWLNVENVGDATVNRVTVTDTYPAGMRMDGGLGGGFWRWWDWRDYGDHFTMTLELLEPGWSAGFNFGLITDTNPLPFGLVFTNTAEVALVANDTNPSDNVDTAVLTTGPDLWVKKDLVAGELRPGELVTFSLAFGNDVEGWQWWWGMQGNAILTDTLPAGFEYISALQHWCGNGVEWCDHAPETQAGSTNVWLLWPLNAGEWNEIYLTARITDTATGLDTFVNQVSIASTQPTLDREPYSHNNSDSYALAIDLPYFTVSKTYASSRVAGTPVTYTLTATNPGNADGTNVVLGDKFPAGFTYTASDGTRVNNSVQWTFATLPKLGGTGHGWFSGVLPCTPGTFTNNDYAVIASDEGVKSAVGAPVSFNVLAPNLAAAFNASARSLIAGETVTFTDTSSTNGPALASWAWDFGDSGKSAAQNPGHTYTKDGVFTVKLTITDTCGFTAVATTTVTVRAPALAASFNQSAASVIRTHTVVFTDTSTTDGPAITAWAWDFGDGGKSTTRHPSHQFNTVGQFTVKLTITDTLGYSDVATSTVNVTPDCQPLTEVDFTYQPTNLLVNAPVTFTASALPLNATSPITYDWSFGDGQAAVIVDAATPHTYTTIGTKTVRLTVINPCTQFGAVWVEKVITIEARKVYLPLVVRAYP